MDIRNKKEELLSKFENGVERYNDDPLFNKVINILLQGDENSILTLLSQLIDMNNSKQDLITKLITKKR